MLARCILIFSALLLQLQLIANDDIYFSHIGARDGLSQVSIMSIYQDEFGAMWFGSTEGLNRYNGRDIEVFRPSENGDGLSQNTIYTICGDKQGSIFFRNGLDLAVYDTRKETFHNIHKGDVYAIRYSQNVLWAVTEDGIMKYNPKIRKLDKFISLNKNIRYIQDMLITDDGIIWIASKLGLVKIDGKDSAKQEYIINNISTNFLYLDSSNKLWVGTNLGGLYEISPNGEIELHQHKKGTNSISSNQIRAVIEDDSANIWVGTFYGLNKYTPRTKQWKHYAQNDNYSHSLTHSSIFSICKDSQGTIWLGTYFGGINYFNPTADIFKYYESKTSIPNSLSFFFVGSMTEDKYGNLWVCTEGGDLNCLNLKTRDFSRYELDNSKPTTGYNQKAIWYREDKDLLYIGLHNQGLAIFDIKTKKKKIINNSSKPNSIPDNTINKIQFYDDYLYIMTQAGLIKMDLDNEVFYILKEDPIVGETLKRGIKTINFLIDSKDRLWLIIKSGVKYINLKTGETQIFTYDKMDSKSIGKYNITDITENSKGQLFFATMGSGILKFNEKDNNFDNYTEAKGEIPSDYVYSINETSSGNLIALYSKGFSLFNPENLKENIFKTSPNFLIEGFNTGNKSYITKDNEIFIGGINGLASFKEEDLYKLNSDYSLFFDKLFVNNQRVYPGDQYNILDQALSLCSDIELNHNQNNIIIEFATSNYLQATTHKYEYMLKGFDEEWIPTDTKVLSYTNLSPGDYTLMVRETSYIGKESSSLYSIDINIKSPFYLTPTAFILYIILLILLIIGIVRFYIWRAKLRTTLEYERKDKERIEELNHTKLKFFTNISHELRTPLTLIIGQLETLLIHEDVSTKLNNRLSKIHKNASNMLKLISELLDFKKQEQGYFKLSVKRIELTSYITSIYESFQDFAKKHKIKYKFDHTNNDIYAYIDPVHFQKSLYNLLSNAFKYTASGGEITISIRQTQAGILIQIADNGIGIPPESLNQIFDRFYQIEYRSSGMTMGTGIGLALTKEIIQSHKGEITVESTLNEGSTFSILLRTGSLHFTEEQLSNQSDVQIINEEYNPDTEEHYLPLTNEDTTTDGDKPTVLIVDDNESLLEMLADSLSPHFKVHTAIDGKEGLDLVYKIEPDLIISDVMLPEVSGKELCYKIKNNIITSHIPVILLTAQISHEQIIDGYMFGADAYITKPFNIRMLISRCKNLIQNRKLLHQKYSKTSESTTQINTISEQDQIFVDKIIKIVKENLNNLDFDMNMLGSELGMGRSKLYTKVKEVTGFTPNELTLNIKLQEAAHMLDNMPHMNISEISLAVGFSSAKYFTKCFKTFYGIVPQDWRKRAKE